MILPLDKVHNQTIPAAECFIIWGVIVILVILILETCLRLAYQFQNEREILSLR